MTPEEDRMDGQTFFGWMPSAHKKAMSLTTFLSKAGDHRDDAISLYRDIPNDASVQQYEDALKRLAEDRSGHTTLHHKWVTGTWKHPTPHTNPKLDTGDMRGEIYRP